MDVVHQARFGIGTDVRLHAEKVLLPFLDTSRGTFSFRVLSRTRRVNDRGVGNRVLAQQQALVSQVAIVSFQDIHR